MERPPRPPHRISKRVLVKWEKLVEKALARSSYNRDGRGRESSSGQRGERAPQSLAQQADIDAVLQAADEIEHESIQVARIRTFLFEHYFLLLIARSVLQYLLSRTGNYSNVLRSVQLNCSGRGQSIVLEENWPEKGSRFSLCALVDVVEEKTN